MKLSQRLIAEFLGTAGLLIVVVGSGIMGETLAQGNLAVALLANSLATAAGLYVLIETLGSVSGAHFNPMVTLVERLQKRLTTFEFLSYLGVQTAGAIFGVMITHLMFGLKIVQLSTQQRNEPRLILSEILATFGLISAIFLTKRGNATSTASVVALYIGAAYWCTSSTSFANPAVTLARSLTDSFTGIQWTAAPGFVLAQLIGGLTAFFTIRLLKL